MPHPLLPTPRSSQRKTFGLWLLCLLLGLSTLQTAHGQSAPPSFQVNVTPAGPLNLPAGNTQTLTASTSYPAFNTGTGFNSTVEDIAIQPDGKILVGGSFTSYNGITRNRMARLNLDGTLDPSFAQFGNGLNGVVKTIALQPDGKILVGGSFSSYNGLVCNRIARLNPDGSLDPTFVTGTGIGTSTGSIVEAIVIQPADGKILVGGSFGFYNGTVNQHLVRLDANGALDTGFNATNPGYFYAQNGATIKTIAIQPDGKIVVGGSFTTFYYPTNQSTTPVSCDGAARLLSTGAIDRTFNISSSGQAYNNIEAISLLPNGSMLVGGNLTTGNSTALIRITSSGFPDSNFNSGITSQNAVILAIEVQGAYVYTGGLNSFLTLPSPLIRFNLSTGVRDPGFSPPLSGNGSVYAVAVQSDGKVLGGGNFTPGANIVRATTLGTLDATSVPGPTGVSYTWNTSPVSNGPSLLVSSSGSYTATATVNGVLAKSAPVIIAIPPVLISSAQPLSRGTYRKITIERTGIARLTGNITIVDSIVVEAGGSLRMGPYRILRATLDSKFRMEPGATLSMGHPAGISLAPDTTGAVALRQRNFSPGASYVYTATSNQVTGAGLPARVRNLTDSTRAGATLTLSDSTSVRRVLTIAGAGNFLLNGQPLVLLSDSSKSALVVNGPAGGRIIGRATMQRDISRAAPNQGVGRRYYSSPVTGPTTTVGSLGTPNVSTYDETRLVAGGPLEAGLVTASANARLEAGKGYAINLAAGAKLSFTGTLTTGNQVLPLTRSNPNNPNNDNTGWQLVGNPYPAPMDWSLLAPSNLVNVGAAIYVYESTGPNAGAYLPYVSGVGRSPIIAAGQSFYVRVNKGQRTGQLTLSDTLRVTSYDTVATFSRLLPPPQVAFALRDGTTPRRPAGAVHLSSSAAPGLGFSPATDAYFIPTLTDIEGQPALSVSISAADPNEELSIKGVPAFDNGLLIPLTIRAPSTTAALNLAVSFRNLPSTVGVFLFDSLTHISTDLSRTPAPAIQFPTQIPTQIPTRLVSRYWLRFGAAAPLPVELTAFTVTRRGPNTAQLTWTTASEKDNARFEVEASVDATSFQPVGQVPGQGTSRQAHNYAFTDDNLARYAPATLVYYRLRQVDTNDRSYYSPVQALPLRDRVEPTPFTAYPQPAQGQVHVLGATPGTPLVLLDLLGRRVYAAPTPVTATGAAELLLPAGLPAGLYLLQSGTRTLRLRLE